MLAKLLDVAVPANPDAVVIVVHGGGSRGDRMHVSPAQLSVLRMIPTAHRVVREGRGRLAVLRLLNSYRGWDSRHTPVDDVRWAVNEALTRFPGRSLGLVGHSLGGRATLLGATAPAIGTVVALNPWLSPDERPTPTRARVLVVHGLRDRIAPASRSAALVQRLASDTRASCITVAQGRHAMLRSGSQFDRYAAEFTAAVLLGAGHPASAPVARVLGGETLVRT